MRRAQEKATSSTEDYGFSNPAYTVVEPLYWKRHNSNGATEPDEGGGLDQDLLLQEDLKTYGWLVGFAENILDEEEKGKDFARGKHKSSL